MWFKSGVGFGELGTGGHVLPYPAGSGDRQSRQLDKVQVDRFLWHKGGGTLVLVSHCLLVPGTL